MLVFSPHFTGVSQELLQQLLPSPKDFFFESTLETAICFHYEGAELILLTAHPLVFSLAAFM